MVSAIGSLTTRGSSSSSPRPLVWVTRRKRQQAYLYKLFVPSSLSWKVAHSDKGQCRKARPSDRGRELDSRCAVQELFFLIFLSICMVIFISPVVFPSCCKLLGFFFHCFISFSNWLIDVIPLKICLKWLISIRIIFPWPRATLQIAVYFNFVNRLFFFGLLCLVSHYVSVVLLLAQRKFCPGLLKRVLLS